MMSTLRLLLATYCIIATVTAQSFFTCQNNGLGVLQCMQNGVPVPNTTPGCNCGATVLAQPVQGVVTQMAQGVVTRTMGQQVSSYGCVISSTSGCTATCGQNGIQTTTRQCMEYTGNDGFTSDATHISSGKPVGAAAAALIPACASCVTATEPCPALAPCVSYFFQPTQWGGCSQTCGSGAYRTRAMQCMGTDGSIADNSRCGTLEQASMFGGLREQCNGLPQCAGPIYRYTEWSECSATCGGGVTNRAVECIDVNSNTTDNDVCVREGAIPVPNSRMDLEKPCNTQQCMDFSYSLSEWGSCSKSCDGGVRLRKLLCRTGGGFVDEAECEAKGVEKPTDDLREDCNIGECPEVEYRPSDWSRCSRDCGGGVQTRILECFAKFRGEWARVSDRECAGFTEKPKIALLQDCNMDPCQTYMWKLTDYGRCSATCGAGLETRELVCQDTKGGTSASEARCAALVRPDAPLQRDCSETPCMTYMWRLSGWTKCSATCGGGQMTRELTCHDAKGDETRTAFCNQFLRPTAPLTLSCAQEPCVTYAWDCSEWSDCNVECGYGTHTRTCSCKGSDDKTYRDDMCPEPVFDGRSFVGSKPAEVETCNSGKICMSYTYSVSPWCTQDPKPCEQNKVTYSRSATCIGPTGQPTDQQFCAGQGIAPKTSYECDAQAVAREMYEERCGPPPTPAPTAGPTVECTSIIDILARDNSIIYAAVQAADLVETLREARSLTLWAPNDVAFTNYTDGRSPVRNLVPILTAPANKETLGKILLAHAVDGFFPERDLVDFQSLTSLAGNRLIVDLKNIESSEDACNGIVHRVTNLYGEGYFSELVPPDGN